jgi:hypothetical protein
MSVLFKEKMTMPPFSKEARDWFERAAGYPLDQAFEVQQSQQGSLRSGKSEVEPCIGRGYPAFGQSVNAQEKDAENLVLIDKIAST